MKSKYYSEDWFDATCKFVGGAQKFGDVRWAPHPTDKFDIPYVSIGAGPAKIVINSGVHGIEGYFGSAAQLMFLDEITPKLLPKILQKYTIVLIHIINGCRFLD